ncbi:Gfo/Idh/MocA family protein [Listeria costaricensis]|uniref:Gfo/Idh/MocA family protein n=1 Tax=Listeria costaricensis TaxID=2026604 RepID=UPI000C07B134|nr:Gfo/Idh/MocA family oxidoreductase [Listeria costaricensis]
MKELTWAIIGPGTIAHQFAEAMQALGRNVYAVGARNRTKGEAFATQYGIEQVYDDFEALFKDEKIDAVYISTPHSNHDEYMLAALEHGKHILVEKAITYNTANLAKVTELAHEKKLIVAEAMTIFHMPLFKKLREVVDSGRLGELKMIQVSFGSLKEANPTNRFFNMELAGGALLDIGTYALSFARFFLNAPPDQILTTAKKYETGVDEQSGILLKNKQGEIATVSLTFRAKMPKRGIVAYENGFITIDDFPRAEKAVISYPDGRTEILETGETARALEYEIQDFESYVAKGENPLHPLTVDVVEIMTEVRNKWGITYPFEN